MDQALLPDDLDDLESCFIMLLLMFMYASWYYERSGLRNRTAEGWRGKPFLIYERLVSIFGKDRASGARAQTFNDMVNEINAEDANVAETDFDIHSHNSLMSVNQTVFSEPEPEPSRRSGKMKGKSKNDFATGFAEVALQVWKQHERNKNTPENNAKYIVEELERLGVDLISNMKMSKAILSHPVNLECFKRAKTDEEKFGFARMFLDNSD